jgi:hypothetical protein
MAAVRSSAGEASKRKTTDEDPMQLRSKSALCRCRSLLPL